MCKSHVAAQPCLMTPRLLLVRQDLARTILPCTHVTNLEDFSSVGAWKCCCSNTSPPPTCYRHSGHPCRCIPDCPQRSPIRPPILCPSSCPPSYPPLLQLPLQKDKMAAVCRSGSPLGSADGRPVLPALKPVLCFSVPYVVFG